MSRYLRRPKGAKIYQRPRYKNNPKGTPKQTFPTITTHNKIKNRGEPFAWRSTREVHPLLITYILYVLIGLYSLSFTYKWFSEKQNTRICVFRKTDVFVNIFGKAENRRKRGKNRGVLFKKL